MPPRTADTNRTATTRTNPRRSGFILTSHGQSTRQYTMPWAKVGFDTARHTFYDANRPIRRPPSAMLSVPHMIVVFIVVLVVFGPHKLPELARGLGKLMAEFRKASTDFKTAFEEEMRDLERQAREVERKKQMDAAAASAAATEAGTA